MPEGRENNKATAKSECGGLVRIFRTEGKAKLIVLTVHGLIMRL